MGKAFVIPGLAAGESPAHKHCGWAAWSDASAPSFQAAAVMGSGLGPPARPGMTALSPDHLHMPGFARRHDVVLRQVPENRLPDRRTLGAPVTPPPPAAG